MSVYAAEATVDSAAGRRFAILLAVLLAWLMYQWWVVRRQDDARMAAVSTPYFIGLAVVLVLVVASIAVEDPATRLALWAVGAAGAIAVPLRRRHLAAGRTRCRASRSRSRRRSGSPRSRSSCWARSSSASSTA